MTCAAKHRQTSFWRAAVLDHLPACTTSAVKAHAVSTRPADLPTKSRPARSAPAARVLRSRRARPCAHLRRAPSVCASRDTRTMSPTTPPSAAAAAAHPTRQRTRPSARTGLVDGRKSWTAESHFWSAWERGHGHYTPAAMAAWPSENDGPSAGRVDEVVCALDRLECRSAGQDKGTDRRTFSVRHFT